MTNFIPLIAAFMLDVIFGDPKSRFHPVSLFGSYARKIENLVYPHGLLFTLITILPLLTMLILINYLLTILNPVALIVFHSLLIYFSICPKTLSESAQEVFEELTDGKLLNARKKVAQIVGRDTENLSKKEIARATVESVSENIVDGITSPIFYAVLFGGAGAFTYRAINTLDSMVGYKNERYKNFGWTSAKLDDLANFIPARMTTAVIMLVSFIFGTGFNSTLRNILTYSKNHSSPNAGLVEAAAAGALNIKIGGENVYDGIRKNHGYIGEGRLVKIQDITRVVRLMWLTFFMFSALCVLSLSLIRGML